MRLRPLTAALVLALPLLAPAAAPADPAPGSGEGGARPEHLQRFRDRLGLSDSQVQTIREVWARHREAARPLWQALARPQRELRQLALDGADDGTIQAKAAEIDGLLGQLRQLQVAALREIGPALSEEQRRGLADLAGWRGHRHHRHLRPAPQS